jgi:ABC-type antimicrobial peptide transport system permease subunit
MATNYPKRPAQEETEQREMAPPKEEALNIPGRNPSSLEQLIDVLKQNGGIVALITIINGTYAILEIFLPSSNTQLSITVIIGIIATIILIKSFDWLTWGIAIGTWAWAILLLLVLSALFTRSAVVSGSLVDGDYNPLARVEMVLIDSSGVPHNTQTNDLGIYELRNIPAGEYKLTARGIDLQYGEIPSN